MPPSNDDLERLASLSEVFSRAVEGRCFLSDSKAAEDVLRTMLHGELDSWGDLAQEIFEMRAELSRSGEKPGEDFLKKVILHADTLADIVTRIVPAESVAESLPEDLKSDANVRHLLQLGAKNLAKLCALKSG